MNNIETRVAKLPQVSQLYYAQILAQADGGDIFTAIENLRKSQTDGSIPTELREAASYALVSMNSHLNGDSKPRQLSGDEARADIKLRIERAKLTGDRKSYDALTEAQAHGAAKAEKAEALSQKRNAEREANNEVLLEEKRELYLELKKSFKDAEMHLLSRAGLTPEQAEAQYQLLSAAGVEQAAQFGSGFIPPAAPIEE